MASFPRMAALITVANASINCLQFAHVEADGVFWVICVQRYAPQKLACKMKGVCRDAKLGRPHVVARFTQLQVTDDTTVHFYRKRSTHIWEMPRTHTLRVVAEP